MDVVLQVLRDPVEIVMRCHRFLVGLTTRNTEGDIAEVRRVRQSLAKLAGHICLTAGSLTQSCEDAVNDGDGGDSLPSDLHRGHGTWSELYNVHRAAGHGGDDDGEDSDPMGEQPLASFDAAKEIFNAIIELADAMAPHISGIPAPPARADDDEDYDGAGDGYWSVNLQDRYASFTSPGWVFIDPEAAKELNRMSMVNAPAMLSNALARWTAAVNFLSSGRDLAQLLVEARQASMHCGFVFSSEYRVPTRHLHTCLKGFESLFGVRLSVTGHAFDASAAFARSGHLRTLDRFLVFCASYCTGGFGFEDPMHYGRFCSLEHGATTAMRRRTLSTAALLGAPFVGGAKLYPASMYLNKEGNYLSVDSAAENKMCSGAPKAGMMENLGCMLHWWLAAVTGAAKTQVSLARTDACFAEPELGRATDYDGSPATGVPLYAIASANFQRFCSSKRRCNFDIARTLPRCFGAPFLPAFCSNVLLNPGLCMLVFSSLHSKASSVGPGFYNNFQRDFALSGGVDHTQWAPAILSLFEACADNMASEPPQNRLFDVLDSLYAAAYPLCFETGGGDDDEFETLFAHPYHKDGTNALDTSKNTAVAAFSPQPSEGAEHFVVNVFFGNKSRHQRSAVLHNNTPLPLENDTVYIFRALKFKTSDTDYKKANTDKEHAQMFFGCNSAELALLFMERAMRERKLFEDPQNVKLDRIFVVALCINTIDLCIDGHPDEREKAASAVGSGEMVLYETFLRFRNNIQKLVNKKDDNCSAAHSVFDRTGAMDVGAIQAAMDIDDTTAEFRNQCMVFLPMVLPESVAKQKCESLNSVLEGVDILPVSFQYLGDNWNSLPTLVENVYATDNDTDESDDDANSVQSESDVAVDETEDDCNLNVRDIVFVLHEIEVPGKNIYYKQEKPPMKLGKWPDGADLSTFAEDKEGVSLYKYYPAEIIDVKDTKIKMLFFDTMQPFEVSKKNVCDRKSNNPKRDVDVSFLKDNYKDTIIPYIKGRNDYLTIEDFKRAFEKKVDQKLFWEDQINDPDITQQTKENLISARQQFFAGTT